MTAAYLFTQPTVRPLTAAGDIMPGAYLQFYESGTTTPTDVYADAGLAAALPNPVVADADGKFVPIYLDPTVTYRVQLYDQNDVLIDDVDPYAPARDYPPGTVLMFFGTLQQLEAAYPPALWQQCNGANGSPDMRDRIPIGVSSTLAVGDTGGSTAGVTTSAAGAHDHGAAVGGTAITEAQMPTHSHRVRGAGVAGGIADTSLSDSQTAGFGGHRSGSGYTYIQKTPVGNVDFVEEKGGGAVHNHSISAVGNHTHTVQVTPPFLALYFIMRRSA